MSSISDINVIILKSDNYSNFKDRTTVAQKTHRLSNIGLGKQTHLLISFWSVSFWPDFFLFAANKAFIEEEVRLLSPDRKTRHANLSKALF